MGERLPYSKWYRNVMELEDSPNALHHRAVWKRSRWCSRHDIVGELAGAVRARGMRFRVYYSTGLDWSVHHLPIRQIVDSPGCIPRRPDYLRYISWYRGRRGR